MIICVVIITGKSLLQGVKTQGDKAYDKAKKDAAKRRERTQALRTERTLKSKQTERKNLCPDRELNEATGMWKASPLIRLLLKKSPEVKELTAEMPAAEAEFPIHRDGEVTFASAERKFRM